MKVQLKLTSRCIVETEGSDVKEMFTQISQLAEVFGNSKCGLCGSENIRPLSRKVDKFTYYEIHCQDCHARLAYGQGENGLFPRLKFHEEHQSVVDGSAELGSYISNGGWEKLKFAKKEPVTKKGKK